MSSLSMHYVRCQGTLPSPWDPTCSPCSASLCTIIIHQQAGAALPCIDFRWHTPRTIHIFQSLLLSSSSSLSSSPDSSFECAPRAQGASSTALRLHLPFIGE